MRHLFLALCLSLVAARPAGAASSEWLDSEGGSIRIVTADAPDDSKKLKGALEIALKPGWKTYWRDPGDTGIPPQIDVSASTNIEAVEIAFPPPVHVDDGFAVWAGYREPVALPLTFTMAEPNDTALIEADVFLGICEVVCIPVQGRLALEPGPGSQDAADAAIVEAAFAALPAEARDGFRVGEARIEEDRLVVTVEVPGDAREANLFVASGGGYLLGVPRPVGRGSGGVVFAATIHEAPNDAAPKVTLDYTLVADDEAVAGKLMLP